MQTRLVLVEGNPFTGKSTLSEYIAQQISLNKHAAEWVPEGLMLEKYFPQIYEALDNGESISDEVVWADWLAFADAVTNSSATFVVDAAISYAAIYPLLAEDRPYADILAFVTRIADLCAPLHPQIIHLIGDSEKTTLDSIAERGDKWEKQMIDQSNAAPYQKARNRSGIEGAITFLEETQELTEELFKESNWQTLTLNITSSDREANKQATLRFLGLTEIEVIPPTLSAPPEAYTGTYAQEDPAGTIGPLDVRLEGDRLALHQPGMRLGILVPISSARFHLTASQLDIEFEMNEGMAQRLTLVRASGKTSAFRRT